MKFDPFGTAWQRMSKADFEHAVDIVGAVRDAVGPDVNPLIEGYGRFTTGQALDVARKLDQFDPT